MLPPPRPSSGHADAAAAAAAPTANATVCYCLLLLLATAAGYCCCYCWWDAVKTTPEVGPGALAKTTMAPPVIPRQLLHRLLQTESSKRSRNWGVRVYLLYSLQNGPTWGEVNGSLLLHEASCGLYGVRLTI
ncbi:hypothetical protein J3F84DRAFT_51110 [Trichoderma pleuroticola]